MIGPAAPEGRVRPFACAFMDPPDTQVSQAQANLDARFPILIAHQKKYHDRVPGMKAAHPDCRVLIYSNGTAFYRTDLADACYAHDTQGRRIAITGWAAQSTWLMEPTSAAWRTQLASQALAGLTYGGYDAVYVDVLGGAGVSPGYVSAVPKNPTTGTAYTKPEWLKACRDLATTIQHATGKQVLGNGWQGGPSYFSTSAPSSIMSSPDAAGRRIDGGDAEGWLRGATQSPAVYPSEARWKQEVALLTDAGGHGVSAFVILKLWTTWTQAQRDAWLEFSAATLLMGNQGSAYLMFTDVKPGKATTWRPFYDVDIGAATGQMTNPAAGLYRRNFAGGVALANLGASSQTIPLGASYTRIPRTTTASTVTLGPKSAAVLKAAA